MYYIINDIDENIIVFISDIKTIFIPEDSENTDYIAYLNWLSEGNVAGPYPV